MSFQTRASPHLRKSKTVLGSGLHAVDSGFKILGFGFFVSLRIPEPSIPACNNTLIFLKLTACCFCFQSKVFSHGRYKVPEQPSVFITAAHHRAGLKRDAASVWLEDISLSSFRICLRELQNYAGSHEDISVVCFSSMFSFFSTSYSTYSFFPFRRQKDTTAYYTSI